MNGKVKRSSSLYTDTISVQTLQKEHPPTKQEVGAPYFDQSRFNCIVSC
jgi:hypothetical protein